MIALQQAGNVKYSGWRMEFSCRVDMVNELQQQARKMEEELEEWETTVTERRNQFYELNNYATLQLLTLRESLGQLKDPARASTATYDPSILTLLQSISSEVSADGVRDVVTQILSDWRTRQFEMTEEHSSSPVNQAFPTADQSIVPATVLSTGLESPAASVSCRPKTVPEIERAEGTQALSPAKGGDRNSSSTKLTEKDLNEEQKEIFAKMVDYNGSNSQLALKALQACGSDRYKVQDWIIHNEVDFVPSDGEEEEEVEEEMDTISEASDSDQEPEFTYPRALSADGMI